MFTTLSLDDTSQWNMTDPSTVGNLTNDGGITLNNASGSTGTLLTVDNTLTLQDGSPDKRDAGYRQQLANYQSCQRPRWTGR
ncbi:host colonisation factor (ShdA) [Salmonella enterica subsp. enterica]|uniref:Host colonisation factor (ShdA) n=1 Tax=Salmonella enterica I TaxID=59201 RepID=A0A379WNT4_SALET|nr:host colonisation factor (ShdA) [Salmonella enterica subsp. enterica]